MTGVLLLGPAAAPALAGGPVVFTDPCGDAQRVVETPDRSVDQETPRSARHDIKQTTFEPLLVDGAFGGVRVTLEVCGVIAPGEMIGSHWTAGAALPGGCSVRVGLVDEASASGSTRTASFSKTCRLERIEVVPGVAYHYPSESRFDIALPATQATVGGTTITWTLPSSQFTGEARDTLAAGVLWESLGSATSDAARGPTVFAGDVRVNGPDVSRGSVPFTLG